MPVATCCERAARPRYDTTFCVPDYNLAATLDSGQAFRWRLVGDAWEGVIGHQWVRVRQMGECIHAEVAAPVCDWGWLADYLQVDVCLADVLATFPNDAPLRRAVAACHGLRLLRQPAWECLATFLLSSTKQIGQIRQIVARLCRAFGEPVACPPEAAPAFAFPTAARLAGVGEADLRACKTGFRARYLRAAAEAVASEQLDLERLSLLSLAEARAALMQLPGVGRKIADCVLLFGCGFSTAFPVDVWVGRALRELYFPRRRVSPRQLEAFVTDHFGPFAGYAQQYLFHYMRCHHVP